MNTNTTMFTDHFCPVDKEHEAFRVFLSQQVVSVGAMSAETNKMKFKWKAEPLNSNSKTAYYFSLVSECLISETYISSVFD